jgi:prevent-host-death family protein
MNTVKAETINVVEAKKNFSDLMSRVAYAGERLVVERHGKPMMAWVSIEDLHRLEAQERNADDVRAQRMAALAMTDMIRERIRQERNGVSLPDSTEVLNYLRENHFRVDEDMR